MLFFFRTLVSWRRFIISAALVGAVIMAAVSFLLPKWYTAAASVFPPETKGGLPIYAQLLESVSAPLLGPMATGVRPESIYIDMLMSRRIGERILEEFNLYEVYGATVIEDALPELQSHAGFTLIENGLLQITFEDQDPERAAAVIERMIELLDEFNRELNVTQATSTRKFVESQISVREQSLAGAEQDLRDFQEQHKALNLDAQLASTLEIVAGLTGQAIALETELDLLGHYTSTNSEEYRRKKKEYDQLVNQIAKLKTSPESGDADMVRSFMPRLEEVPELALEMLRLKRRIEIENTVYTMLVKEYEKARIDEARDTPTVQVLDTPMVPNQRSRPKRKMLVIVGAVLGAAWASIIALVNASWKANEGKSRVISEVFGPLVGDFNRFFRRKKSQS